MNAPVDAAPPLVLDPKALESYLPHRGVNLLPDRVELAPDRQSAVSHTRIAPGDARGRECIGRRDGAGNAAWSEVFIGELMALTGVCLLHDRFAPGQVGVFSMISRVSVPFLPPLHAEIVGHARITRDRGAFTVFETKALCDGKVCLAAEVMSGSGDLSAISAQARTPLSQAEFATPHAADYAWKPRHLRFIDAVLRDDEQGLTCTYTYPVDHPFVPGHFPATAVMMGMTQWQAVADAAYEARRRAGLRGPIIANGSITRSDGSPVIDVRDLLLVDDGSGEAPRIATTKRIAFRGPVQPGDGLLIHVTIAPAHTEAANP